MASTFSEIIKSEKPTLVDFYADWCGPCKMMHPVLYKLKDDLGESVKILKINVDKNASVSEKFQIRGVPTFILFKNSKIVWRKSGALSLEELKMVILNLNN